MAQTRLTVKTSLSPEQAQIAKYLMDMPGICTCGQELKPTDQKALFSQVNSEYVGMPEARNLLLIAAYCAECFNKINALMRALRNPAVARTLADS